MTSTRAGSARRGTAKLVSAALAVAGLAAVGVGTVAAPAQAAETAVSNATFTWGLNGYAQQGIFGPWTYKNLTGNVKQLTGSVADGNQSAYAVAAQPATSMPVSTPQKTPNAITFGAGTGTTDPATGESEIAWTGSYTVNAYPAQYGAPDEIYSNPQLTLDADGNGEVTMNFALGAGKDMDGNPTPAVDLGRLPVMTFAEGDVVANGPDRIRATPEYLGVEVTVPSDSGAQTRSCTAGAGSTGWWGSWPQEFVTAVPASIRPHFYSTGCGGLQDAKPALPLDVDFGLVADPKVTVSRTTLAPNGTHEVTVTGTGFDPSLAVGTRPPFAGQRSGLYVAFGRYLDAWRPSAGGTGRTNPTGANGNGAAVRWAVPTASFAASNPAQDPTSSSYTTLGEDGSFSTVLKVDQSWLASAAGNFGIYTYTGGGPAVAYYETATPITFAKATPTVAVTAAKVTYGADASATVSVSSADGNTGSVTLSNGTTTVGTADLAAGTATFALGKLGAGSYPLTASYAGTDAVDAGTGTTTLVVAKAGTTAKVKVTKKPKPKKAGRATVTVTSPSGAVAGATKVVLKDAKGKAVKGVKAGKVKNGKATVKLPKLAKGKYTLVVTFQGGANLVNSKKQIRFKVA